MKKILQLLVCFLFVVVFTSAQSTNPYPKGLVEKNWTGLSEQTANFTRSGKIQLKQTLSLTLNDDYTVVGYASTRMTLDGKSYFNKTAISGKFTKKDWSLYIKEGSMISADILPSGLKWCKGEGTLTFFINNSKPGYYLLKGNLSDNCGGNSAIEYSDSPSN